MTLPEGWGATYIKGLLIGLAELIPGISGGTVALITGIYTRLVTAIGHFDWVWLKSFKDLPKAQAFKQIADHADLYFLLVLGLGMLTTVLMASGLVHWLLENHKLLLWAFFFGLMVGATYLLIKQTKGVQYRHLLIALAGLILSLAVTQIQIYDPEPSFWLIMLSGGIAGCVWILPGLSGSFMLLILGMYEHFIKALAALDLSFLVPFGLGLALGLPAFSRLLSRLLNHYRTATLWFLIAFIVGSVHRLWPWQQVVSYYHTEAGGQLPLEVKPVLPATWQQFHSEDPMIWSAVLLMLAGGALIVLIERKWQRFI